MNYRVRFRNIVLALAGLALAAPALRAQETKPAAPDMVRVIVTVMPRGKGEPPVLAKEDVVVRQDKERRPVVDWVPAGGEKAGLNLAILVDDSLDTSVGSQLDDLSQFIRGLPPTTRVAVAYGNQSRAEVRQDFTADHELAIKALRIPFGRANDVSSIFLSLADLLKRWPAGGNRGEVLLISDGIDIFRGVADSSPGLNVDLQEAIDLAQRHGVAVFSLFASGAGRFHRNFFLVSNGQSCLARLALETGGEAYFQGFQTPVAFRPFLEDMAKLLGRQYLLTFRAQPGKKAGFARLHVTTEVPGAEISAPSRVYVPAAQ